MTTHLVPLNDDTFDTWTANEIELTVVCVGADWCEGTKALKPVLEDLSADYARTVRFAMVDFDASPQFAKAHGVTAVPTVLLFKLASSCGQVDIICSIEARRDTIEEAIRRFV